MIRDYPLQPLFLHVCEKLIQTYKEFLRGLNFRTEFPFNDAGPVIIAWAIETHLKPFLEAIQFRRLLWKCLAAAKFKPS